MTAGLRRLLPLLLAALVLSACPAPSLVPDDAIPTGPSPITEPTPLDSGGSLRFGLSAEPGTLDPGWAAQTEDLQLVTALFRSLTQIGPDGSVLPAAAIRWTPNDDATSYTFELRPGALFHDGSPVTADAFVRAWGRLFDGPAGVAPNAYHLAPVVGFAAARDGAEPLTGVRAIDAMTLQVDLRHAYEGFEAVVAHPSLAPVPAAAVEDSDRWREQPVGNGPFEMAEPWQHDQFVRVVRFADYRPIAAHLEEVVFPIASGDDGAARSYAEFEAGRLQVADVPGEALDQAHRDHGTSPDGYRGPGVVTGASATTYYYGFDTLVPPLDDVDVRRALSLLIDRERIAREVFGGTRLPATSIVPPGVPGHDATTCAYCTYDPVRAVALLAEKQIGSLSISIDDLPGQLQVAERIKADIETATGIPVTVTERSFRDHLNAIRSEGVQVFRLGWPVDHPAADNVLFPLFHSSSLGDTNVTRYANADTDALLDEARRTRDLPGRIALWQRAERAILDLAPLAPIVYYRLGRVVAPEVSGLRFTPYGWADLTSVRLRP